MNRNAPVRRQNGRSSRNFIPATVVRLPNDFSPPVSKRVGRRTPVVQDVTFTEWLSGLKTSGSNLLVTGEVPEMTSADFSRTLFGRGGRTRVLGLVDPLITVAESYLPVPTGNPQTRVIDRRPEDRGLTIEEFGVPDNCSHRPTDVSLGGGLRYQFTRGAKRRVCARRIWRFGLDSVEMLETNDDLVSVGQFLRGPTALVRGVRGMAHYHLRVPDDDPMVAELSPLFDARIELQKRPGWAEQRWHVPNSMRRHTG